MIITLCGSARFEPVFHLWNKILSLSGHLVFTLSTFPSYNQGEKEWYTAEEKATVDEVHKAKIETSEAVVFLNVLSYVGESTMGEFKFARELQKKIFFLERWRCGEVVRERHPKLKIPRRILPDGYKSPLETTLYPTAHGLLNAEQRAKLSK